METFPPEIFILIVAVISAFAGALLTWMVGYATRGEESDDSTIERASESTDEPPLLEVSRTKESLVVFVQGKHYSHLREITDPQTGRETVSALKAVLAFAEGWLPSLKDKQEPSPTPSQAPSADAATFLKQLRQRGASSSARVSTPPSSKPSLLVEEINDLVQERLQRQPDLADRSIRLTSDLDGSLLIYVGQESFSSVSEIPNAEIRTLIQAAIHDWESR